MYVRAFTTISGWVVVFLIILARPAFGQLTLNDFAPADGTTEVNTTASVTFTFSEALDTGTAFNNDDDLFDDLFLGLDINPVPGVLLDTRVSGDGRTVTLDLQLADDTTYQVVLSGARSVTGAFLDRPYEFTFATGATLPNGTISGIVSFDGGDPTGAIVEVFPLTGTLSINDALAAAVVTDPSGAYTADFIPEGDYVVGAFKELNEDGIFTDPYEDALRLYDDDGDQVIDLVAVGAGAAVNGIDLAVRVPEKATVRGRFAVAQTLARTLAADAHLGTARARVSFDGEAPSWQYLFFGPAEQDSIAVVVIGDQFYAGHAGGDTVPFDFSIPLPDDWVDSDSAMARAEAAGGAEYRQANPDVFIIAALGNLTDERCEQFGGRFLANLDPIAPRTPSSIRAEIGRALQPADKTARQQARWLIIYAPLSFGIGLPMPLALCVDAESGDVKPSLTTAKENEFFAQGAAGFWALGSWLVAVETASEQGVSATGEAEVWAFSYYSRSRGQARKFFMRGGFVLSEEDVDPDSLPSLVFEPLSWSDSDLAADSAEARSQGFRDQHPDAVVTALMAAGQDEDDPERHIWRFTYTSAQDNEQLIVDLNADVLAGVFSFARSNKNEANTAAAAWAADAALVAVGSTRGSVETDGRAPAWDYLYYSSSNNQARRFTMAFPRVIAEEEVDPDSLLSLDPLPELWFDASVPLLFAQQDSDNFRGKHPDAEVTAFLSRGQRDDTPELPIWRISYTSVQDDTTLTLDYDAETGALVQTQVEEEPGVPGTFVLEQNYPNPFNPTTHIPFGLARSGPVTLTVYNVLGQKVATLVDQILPAGTYTFTWQPKRLPSGVYLYQLKTAETVLSRTMTLRK